MEILTELKYLLVVTLCAMYLFQCLLHGCKAIFSPVALCSLRTCDQPCQSFGSRRSIGARCTSSSGSWPRCVGLALLYCSRLPQCCSKISHWNFLLSFEREKSSLVSAEIILYLSGECQASFCLVTAYWRTLGLGWSPLLPRSDVSLTWKTCWS